MSNAASGLTIRSKFSENFDKASRDFERRWLVRLLTECSGNVLQAAQRSGLTRIGLYKKAERLGVNVSSYRQ